MSGQQQQPNVGGTEHLTPTKQALTSLKSDVTRETAIKELIDNAIDAWTRNSGRTAPARIEVFGERHDEEDRTELVVRDDTGGVRRENATVVFTLGATADSTGYGLIGTYGLGAKKALMNLGLPFTIASHHEDEDVGWSYTITEEWFDDDEDWSVEITPEEDIEPGVTELRVHDLDYQWFEDEDDEGATVPERLREEFGRTYNLFLADDLGEEAYDLTIEVQGEPVQPLGSPDWTFTPFDGMYARRFEDIEIDIPGRATTDVTITVGLLRQSSSRTAGIDVYIQGRQVVHAARDKRVGFGLNLDEFDPGHDGRFKVIVEMETDGNGQDLPWDTQKNNLDPYNPIMEKARNWIKRTTSSYLALKDGRVPKAFVKPYGPSADFAANGGELTVHDFSNRYQVGSNFRPNTDLPELKKVRDIAEAHATLRFRCELAVDEEQAPAYKAHVDSQLPAGTSYTDLTELDVDPVELDEDEADGIASKLEDLAADHVDAGIKYSADLPGWQVPKYEAAIRDEARREGAELDELDEPDSTPDDVPTTIDDLDAGGSPLEGGEGPEEPEVTGMETESEDDEVEQEDTVEVALRVIRDGEGLEAPIKQMTYSEAIDQLGLDEDATKDDIAAVVSRRVTLALEM